MLPGFLFGQVVGPVSKTPINAPKPPSDKPEVYVENGGIFSKKVVAPMNEADIALSILIQPDSPPPGF